ncbi:hypothetical protein L6164_026953 [Bauhinia variegata]|uniref:Uncharacterized protein n=1 Tax=Bauhinia variegata TaxID=167791 RepID=A0ACB9LRN9_BAUVA|nr:hypothetical protein L6164_026953 [Bauhinia variegata]
MKIQKQNLEGENFEESQKQRENVCNRPRSMYKKHPGSLSVTPSEGPNLGYLAIQEAETYCCFGFWKNKRYSHLPFPQNENLTVLYTESHGEGVTFYCDKVLFIPVLNQPLSSSRYYVVRRQGKHHGEACTSSKEEDMGTCFCCKYVKDVKTRPLDPFNPYQQFEIIKKRCGFYAKSIVEDGFPPLFLRRKDCYRTSASLYLMIVLIQWR